MASKIHPNVKFKLFGDKKKSNIDLNKNPNLSNFEFFHTNESIKSDDEPVNALRKLKKSSMRLGINCVKSMECDGFVSAGNTGALMAISKFVLKTIKGIDRPAICRHTSNYERTDCCLDLGS